MKEAYMKLLQYLNRYGKYYSEREINIIIERFGECLVKQTGVDAILQILSALNLLRPDRNVYNGFLKEIKKYFDIKSDVLEIGCGHYPALAEFIDKEQSSLGGGSITAYDPKLAIPSLGHIQLRKAEFDKESLNPYDLIISTYPCTATEMVIKKCNKERKPFFLALCSCPPYNFFNPDPEVEKEMVKRWHEYLYFQTMSTLDYGAEIDVTYLDSNYGNECPIFVKTYKNR